MQIILNNAKGHSPKNRFLEQWVADLLEGKPLDETLTENCVLPQLPLLSQDAIMTIQYGITHGKVGAVLVKVDNDHQINWLSCHVRFKTVKADKIEEAILTYSD